MAFSFLVLLQVVTRKTEPFKFWRFFFPKNCTSPAVPHNPGVPSPGLHAQLQCLPKLSRSSLPKPFQACIHNFSKCFYTGEDKASVCFTLPAGITSPLSGLSHCLLSQLLSQPNSVEAEESSAFHNLPLLPCRAGSTLSATSA